MSNKSLIKKLVNEINNIDSEKIKIMEVCGTHTRAIAKHGIRQLVSSRITLLSGPGCPVCVTPEAYIDAAIELATNKDIILATFGDTAKVRGVKGSIIDLRMKGKKVFIVYSPLDVLKLAEENNHVDVVFFAAGFETTMPTIALTVKIAEGKGIKNLYFINVLKFITPILKNILRDSKGKPDGIICPGHVATVMGANYFRFIGEEFEIPSAICGFEPLDIVGGIFFLSNRKLNKKNKFINFYRRCVKEEGNQLAKRLINEVFDVSDTIWRGIGEIKDSGCIFRQKYNRFDALNRYGISIRKSKNEEKCQCSDIIMGKRLPNECIFFGKVCTPQNPHGPCMVSSEGPCNIFYIYGKSDPFLN